jgi:hypothetical protein
MDRVLSRRVLEDVSSMAKRYMQLSKLDAVRIPSDQTAVYIREAAQVYAHGFFQASSAMRRAAVEQALKERLGFQGMGERKGFRNLVKKAEEAGVLDPTVAEQARDFRQTGKRRAARKAYRRRPRLPGFNRS